MKIKNRLNPATPKWRTKSTLVWMTSSRRQKLVVEGQAEEDVVVGVVVGAVRGAGMEDDLQEELPCVLQGAICALRTDEGMPRALGATTW